jgi:putative redox protein
MSYASAAKTGEGQFQVRIQSGPYNFLMDEPSAVGGLDSGPNPFDLLCSALAGCTLMTLKLYVDRKGWALDQLNVHVTHHKEAAEDKDRFECIVELGDVTSEQRERLLSIARRCPVHLVLERSAEVPTSVEPNEPWGELAA